MRTKMKSKGRLARITNSLESSDTFPVNLPFNYTAKAQKGTFPGFLISWTGLAIIWAYVYTQFKLFVTHKADSYSTSNINIDFEN